ncbi:glycine zipper 2TM domain-containing protein [Altererythrobacter arenosus]|uniref:17 kDa surface antigen n=1 Tax=Altererythrobacter arenosus TaxID=3032592 RepID=A0ABY8FRC4_9SPHN|nr:glycine zipper 2TM domain-containing protein [Altererythrobacter sp. CAU 1644]WFL77564.1 glycine zipper 2TM domain-containing protein [Altererythrobacter sp. CAU 1644]
MLKLAKQAAIISAAGLTLAVAAPVSAAEIAVPGQHAQTAHVLGDMTFEHKRKRHKHRHYRDSYYDRGDRYSDRYDRYDRYGEPVHRNTRIWRGRDNRYYCRKENGTTGLLIGAGVGALAGHEIAGRGGDRTLGAILGAAGGAILGRAIDRSSTRCR